jgi:Xaa-Pro aminopeptidase
MRKELTDFRKIMKNRKITAWLSPCSDRHGGEYISAYDQCVKYLSGFTGDSSTLLILEKEAYLWTDGRYFVQAEKELKGSGISLMKAGEPGVPSMEEFIVSTLSDGDTFGFYAPLIDAQFGEKLVGELEKKHVGVHTDEDIVDMVWKNRPARSCHPVFVFPVASAGEDTGRKLRRIRLEMKKSDCDCFITSHLDEIAWLTNLRGADIECNPLFLSHLIVTKHDCRLFIQKKEAGNAVRKYLRETGITLCDYDDWTEAVKSLKGFRIFLDKAKTDYETFTALSGGNRITDAFSPVALMKCVKNKTEIMHMRESHIRDGVYVTKFLYRLLSDMDAGKKITETDAAEMLDGIRAADRQYVSLSFPTISACGSNAAMCHYMPEKKTAAVLKKKGFYLVDSGAQYKDGTTDVTRTFALGETTAREKRDYTLTVIGMLRLMHAVFPAGIRGTNLDTIARMPLWEHGLDFNHGTGHGVGFLNTVHEMPVSVRMRPSKDPRMDVPFCPGMITSDEPGIYIAGEYGIRTENMILCVKDGKRKGFFAFEPLTFVPLDERPLDVSVMTGQDIQYFNDYQKQVREKIGPHLNAAERAWLIHETAEIG